MAIIIIGVPLGTATFLGFFLLCRVPKGTPVFGGAFLPAHKRPGGAAPPSPGQRPGDRIRNHIFALQGQNRCSTLMMLPFQGAVLMAVCIPRALPWARWCCPFGAPYTARQRPYTAALLPCTPAGPYTTRSVLTRPQGLTRRPRRLYWMLKPVTSTSGCWARASRGCQLTRMVRRSPGIRWK